MSDRPSQHKVVGVANRYIAYLEEREKLGGDRLLMQNKDLDIFEAHRVGWAIGLRLARIAIEKPVQNRRRAVLWNMQQLEGLAVGEENIAKFALRLCSQPEKYPHTAQTLRKSSQE